MLNAGGWLLVVVGGWHSLRWDCILPIWIYQMQVNIPYIWSCLYVKSFRWGTRNAEQNLTNYTRRSCVHTPLFLFVLHVSLTTCILGTYVGDIRKCAKLTSYATRLPGPLKKHRSRQNGRWFIPRCNKKPLGMLPLPLAWNCWKVVVFFLFFHHGKSPFNFQPPFGRMCFFVFF